MSGHPVPVTFSGETPIEAVRERLRPFDGAVVEMTFHYTDTRAWAYLAGRLGFEDDGSVSVDARPLYSKPGPPTHRHRDREIATMHPLYPDGSVLDSCMGKYKQADVEVVTDPSTLFWFESRAKQSV